MNVSSLSNLTDAQRAELRRRVTELVARHRAREHRRAFLFSLLTSIILTGLGYGIPMTIPGAIEAIWAAEAGWMVLVFPAAAIVMNLIYHGFSLLNDTQASEEQLRGIYTGQALSALLMADDAVAVKPKRDEARYALTDDGELLAEADVDDGLNAVEAARRMQR